LSTLLLDASALLAAFDKEDAYHESAKALLADQDVSLVTLDLARYEIANVAVCAWREPEWVASLLEAVDRIADDGGVIASDTKLLEEAAKLAEERSISVYDAAYVAAASRGARTLISCDRRDLLSKDLAVSPSDARSPSAAQTERPATD